MSDRLRAGVASAFSAGVASAGVASAFSAGVASGVAWPTAFVTLDRMAATAPDRAPVSDRVAPAAPPCRLLNVALIPTVRTNHERTPAKAPFWYSVVEAGRLPLVRASQ